MNTEDYPGAHAYSTEIATTYEEDRRREKLWDLEQDYVLRATKRMATGSSLLDIPVGTGRFLSYYEEKNLNVRGVDIAEAMLTEARNKIKSELIRLEAGDARSLQMASDSFDYVVCWRLLHLLPLEAVHSVVSELARVAKGTLYVQAYVRDNWHFLLRVRGKLVRILLSLRSCGEPACERWSHIRSYEHDEAAILQIFSDCSLSLQSIDVLGLYGSLRVKVYVLNKV